MLKKPSGVIMPCPNCTCCMHARKEVISRMMTRIALSLELLRLKECVECGSQRSKGLLAKDTFIAGEP